MKYWRCAFIDDKPVALMRSRGIYTESLFSPKHDRSLTTIENEVIMNAHLRAHHYQREANILGASFVWYVLLDPSVSELRKKIYPAVLAVIHEVDPDSWMPVQTVIRMSYEEVKSRPHFFETDHTFEIKQKPYTSIGHYESQCQGKRPYKTMAAARREMNRMNSRYHVTGHIGVYCCPVCNRYHIGRDNNIKLKNTAT